MRSQRKDGRNYRGTWRKESVGRKERMGRKERRREGVQEEFLCV